MKVGLSLSLSFSHVDGTCARQNKLYIQSRRGDFFPMSIPKNKEEEDESTYDNDGIRTWIFGDCIACRTDGGSGIFLVLEGTKERLPRYLTLPCHNISYPRNATCSVNGVLPYLTLPYLTCILPS